MPELAYAAAHLDPLFAYFLKLCCQLAWEAECFFPEMERPALHGLHYTFPWQQLEAHTDAKRKALNAT
jgi:hypothetical protein